MLGRVILLRRQHLFCRGVFKQHFLVVVCVEQIVLIQLLILLVEDIIEPLLGLFVCLSIRKRLAVLLHEDPKLFLDLCRVRFQAFVLATLASLAANTRVLQSFSIAQRVERVVGGAHARAYASKHDDFDVLIGDETVPKHHSQLALAERHMLALRALALLRVQSADALLQTKQ